MDYKERIEQLQRYETILDSCLEKNINESGKIVVSTPMLVSEENRDYLSDVISATKKCLMNHINPLPVQGSELDKMIDYGLNVYIKKEFLQKQIDFYKRNLSSISPNQKLAYNDLLRVLEPEQEIAK